MLTSNRCDRFVLALIVIGAGAGCEETSGGVPDGGTGPIPAIVCPWGKDFPVLQLPMSEVKGVLKGQSRNPSTTCTRQRGTGGPDTVYVLPIAARTTVELEAISTIDTVLAIRTACDDPLTESACNDNPTSAPGTGGVGGGGGPMADPAPPPPFARDAGAPLPPDQPPGDGRDAVLRATLNPGTYYVIVDEAEPFGVGGNFTLRVRSSSPPAHTACTSPRVLTDGVSLPAEELDVAAEKPPACSGAEPRPALYYSARIPSGQRLTVRALATGGDREWSPVLQLVAGCKGRCLARDQRSDFGDRQLRYVNNAAEAEDVILAVSASTAVSGATFRLDVSLGEPVLNGTCAAARPITDGQILRNQDLSEGQANQQTFCIPSGGQTLYYSVTLLPQQQLSVVTSTRDTPRDPLIGPIGKVPLFMALHTGCSQMDCRTTTQGGDRLDYVNSTNEIQRLILQVSNLPGLPPQVFDMMVSMPLPPGSIMVRALGELFTTESGGKASFEVSLGAPPSAEVMIPLESSAPTEGTVTPAALRFGPTDWEKPQTVTVTGVDDSERDGNQPYRILVKPAVTTDARYKDVDGDDVPLVNRDNEASFTFLGGTPLTTSESGNTVTFSVVPNKRPTADVTLPLSTSDATEGTVTPASLTFTAANWETPQFVTVTGVDDKEQDGAQPYKIVTGAVASADAEYSGLDPEDLEALNADNEFVFVQAHAVNGGLPCFTNGLGRHVAVDELGAITVAMPCQDFGGTGGAMGGSSGGTGGSSGGGSRAAPDAGAAPPGGAAPIVPQPPISMGPAAFSVTSTDGGVTFGPPRRVGIVDVSELHVVGGPPGVVYLVAQARGGIQFSRSENGGVSWTAPVLLDGGQVGGNLRIGAAGKRVVVSGFGRSGPAVWWSDDGGRRFQLSNPGRVGSVMGLRVKASGEVWLYVQEMTGIILKSSDGGASFETVVTLPGGNFFDAVAFGEDAAFATGKEPRLFVFPLEPSQATRSVDGLSQELRGPRTLIVDGADNVTVLDNGFMGVEARRLPAGARAFDKPKPLGGFEFGASSGAALSENAVALAVMQSGQVMVSVQTWP